MPIHLVWDNEDKTILRFDFEGTWTWEDVQSAHDQATEMTANITHTIHTIFDVEKSASKPRDLMINMRRLAATRPANWGKQAIVRQGQFAKAMISTYTRLFGNKTDPVLFHVDTLEEARQRLKR